jgi:hypothetical protein
MEKAEMDVAVRPLEEVIRELPADLRVEVRDFAEFLLTRRRRPVNRKLRQDWTGALQAYRDQYSSVELQHLSLEWREE